MEERIWPAAAVAFMADSQRHMKQEVSTLSSFNSSQGQPIV
jgi:hypothetical protein